MKLKKIDILRIAAAPTLIAFGAAACLATIVHDSWHILVSLRMVVVLFFVVALVFNVICVGVSIKGPVFVRRWWLGGVQALVIFILSTILHASLFPGSGGILASIVGQTIFALIMFGWVIFILGVGCFIIMNFLIKRIGF